jgi:hypothetical protein
MLRALQAEGLALDTLSMGMSADLESAVAEGATLVRVGSAIFGPRHARPASDPPAGPPGPPPSAGDAPSAGAGPSCLS